MNATVRTAPAAIIGYGFTQARCNDCQWVGIITPGTGNYSQRIAQRNADKHNTERHSSDTVTHKELAKSIATALNIPLCDATNRVNFTTDELEIAGPNYSEAQAVEIERCIAADLQAGK